MKVFHPVGSEFHRMTRLPPYVFGIVNQLKMEARRSGEDIIDLGMGNPDLATPKHIVNKLIESVKNPRNHLAKRIILNPVLIIRRTCGFGDKKKLRPERSE